MSDDAPAADRLADPDPDVAAVAMGELVEGGGAAVPALIAVLTGDDPAAGARAAEALGMIGADARTAGDALAAALDAADETLRAQAATALAHIGDHRALTALARTIDDDADVLHADWTRSAYTLLGLGPAAVGTLVPLLDAPSPATRGHAALVLRTIADQLAGSAEGAAWKELRGAVTAEDPSSTDGADVRDRAERWLDEHSDLLSEGSGT